MHKIIFSAQASALEFFFYKKQSRGNIRKTTCGGSGGMAESFRHKRHFRHAAY
jgi:hypothetical protein